VGGRHQNYLSPSEITQNKLVKGALIFDISLSLHSEVIVTI
jgi:hypothetical protein